MATHAFENAGVRRTGPALGLITTLSAALLSGCAGGGSAPATSPGSTSAAAQSVALPVRAAATAEMAAVRAAHNTWRALPPMPTGRFGAGAATIAKHIYVIGGYDAAGPLGTNEMYDPAANTWKARKSMPTPRWAFASAVVGNVFYAIGGEVGTGGTQTAVVQAYDPVKNAWSTKKPLPSAFNSTSAVVEGGKIYVVGGFADDFGRLATVEVYDPQTNTWSAGPSMNVARSGIALGAIGTLIVAADGLSNDGATEDNEGYTPPATTWTTLASSPADQYNVCSGVIGTKLYVAGGSSSQILSLLEIYDEATNSWASGASMEAAVTLPASAILNGQLLCFGGSNDNLPGGTYSDLVQAYTP